MPNQFTADADWPSTGYIDFTITRPAAGSQPSRVTFTLSAAGYVDGTDGVDVTPQEINPPDLDVVATPGTTSFTISYTVSATTFEYSVDGAAYGAVPASPFSVTRNAAGGADKTLTFRAVRDGVTVTAPITIPPQVGTAANPPIANNVHVTGVNNTSDEITVAWNVENLGSYTMDLDWSLGGSYHGANPITTISGVTSPYVHDNAGTGGHSLDLTNGGTVENIYYQIVVKNGATIMAMSEPFAYQVDHA